MKDDEISNKFAALFRGQTYIAGEVTLSTSGGTTTVVRSAVSADSTISLTPLDDGAYTEGVPKCVPANGSFVLTHSATAVARNYRYVVHTPQ